ncbi:hypothetical protein PR048_018259 [Dryococelus australis]|uniref:Uncharacterized protein n=1 Tax=Dryococelus australis TaxID=614101 RepID=A0ABQ9HBT5_9NEOP|nr:hypothetical protein PR048_018259 [Dryococelus australis]
MFDEGWTQAATPENAMSGFRATEIFPFNPKAIPETAVAPSDVSDCTPLPATPSTTPTASSTSNNTQTTSTSLATVHSLIATPKIIRNTQKTRHSLNVKATRVTRQLFSKGVEGNADQPSTTPVHKRSVRSRKNNDDMHCADCGRNYYKSKNVLWIQCVECKM